MLLPVDNAANSLEFSPDRSVFIHFSKISEGTLR